MSDTDAENTRWVEVWAVNASDHYGDLQAAASEGPEALRELVYELWTNAKEGGDHSGTYYQAREMSEADYELVDWAEVAETLPSE